MAIQEFSRSLPMMLYRALDAVMPRFRMIFNEFGLTEQQWRVLRVLWERDNIAFRDLARATLITAPSLVGVVDRLETAELVGRRRSDADRRNVFIFATDKGRDLHRQVQPKVDKAYAELRGSIEPAEWKQTIDNLDRVASLKFESPDGRQVVNQ